MQRIELGPFLRWAGGKNWIIPYINKLVPSCYNRYYEPFLGGGAVFFALTPQNAIISDVNEELIHLYLTMRDHPAELREKMKEHNDSHNKEYYYYIRACSPSDPVERAARTLYLNRTCYNGLYRVNKKGEFNVPIGTKNECLKDLDIFELYAEILSMASINCGDFEQTVRLAENEDLIFADPPYATQENTNNFTKYTNNLFSWKDQERLCQSLCDARDKGAVVIATNCACSAIEELYSEKHFFCSFTTRASCISGCKKRGRVTELLITSFPQEEKENWR